MDQRAESEEGTFIGPEDDEAGLRGWMLVEDTGLCTTKWWYSPSCRPFSLEGAVSLGAD